MLTFGLRWPRSQARVLLNISEEAARHGQGDVSLYLRAAESVADNEPLVVHCEGRAEIEQMAALFVALGVRRPAIEDLNGG